MTDIDPKLLEFATPAQRKKLEAWIDLGSSEEAGRALGITGGALRHTLKRVKRNAALRGYAPDARLTQTPAPPGLHLHAASIYNKATEESPAHWVKFRKDHLDWHAYLESTVEGLEERMAERGQLAPAVGAPSHTMADLLAVYAIGDPHLALAAWKSKSGDDFNSHIMTRELTAGITLLAERTVPAEEALIINEGDFFNYDTPGKTTARGTPQDTDVPLEVMIDMGFDLMVELILIALGKHQRVTVMTVKGNHDDSLSYTLTKYLKAYFREEPRVNILVSHDPYQYIKYGNVLLGGAHGNYPKKLSELEPIMARDCDRNGLWESGGKQYRVWYTGHVHHDRRLDLRNCTVITSRTLAPGSAWSHHAGYRSIQSINCDVYHKHYGPAGNTQVGIDEIRDYVRGKQNVDSVV